MSITEKSRKVEELFKSLEVEISHLKKETGVHCIENCIYCCTTPKIMATSLEFYPLAYHLYKTGQAELVLEKIHNSEKTASCPLLNSISIDGSRIGCTQYENRGMICRLFTYNYSTDKHGFRKISACKAMKLAQPDEIRKTNEILKEKSIGPRASGYYSQLQTIDFIEGQNLYPIREAITTAIENVLTYYHYKGSEIE
ncbi:MAG: YkgJ family cysteine cluster protein [Salinivirgaceae bacterium]